MGMMKALYQDFLDRAGIDPEEEQDPRQLEKAFREFTASQITTPSIKKHKTDKIANIEQAEGDWNVKED